MSKLVKMSPTRGAAAAGMVAVFLFFLVALPASASVNALRNAFNPRGFFVTLKSTDQPEWLRSSFEIGFYRAGEGGQGGGGGGGNGNGSNSEKDDLGHTNVRHIDGETGLDYVDAADVDTIYSTYDHNPSPGATFMIGYCKDEQANPLEAIPNFTKYIGTPARGSGTVPDPSGGQWWTIPIKMDLGEAHDDGTADAMAPGTLYEFAYLRGNQANNGTTCVLMPGEADGTYKGYLYSPATFTEEERAQYEAHKYDEYEFITAIYPEGTSSDTTVDHTIESVPMRFHIQTYSDLSGWYDSEEYHYAESFLASVTEQDFASGKYVRENVEALRSTKEELDNEADESVKYQLQKDAEWTIQQMIDDLKEAITVAESPKPTVNFAEYNASLANAEAVYNDVKEKTGTAINQYLPEPVEALKQAIDHARSTINDSSSQDQVDAEKSALDSATVDVLNALVRPDERIYTDNATGIIVTAPYASLSDEARLAVREVVAGTAEYDEMAARVTPAPDRLAIYRILFYDGVDVVYPTQPVNVQIPLLDSLEQTAPNVYYLDNAESPAQQVDATAVQGYRIFETENLGTFGVGGVVQEEPTQPQEEPSQQQENPTQPQEEPTQQQENPTQPQEEPTQQQENPTQPQEEPTQQQEKPTQPQATPMQPQQNPQPVTPQNQTPQQNQNNPVHSTTRTTTRSTATRTTRIIRTTRNNQDAQNRQNEMTTTSVLQTQAVQPTTMTTTAPPPTTAQDTSDLEQEPNQHTLLYIALAVAAVGIGAAAYEFYKEQKNDGLGTDHDEEL